MEEDVYLHEGKFSHLGIWQLTHTEKIERVVVSPLLP